MAFFAARQPILDTDKNLVAYELLFRESLDNVFPNVGDDQATSKMIEGLQLNLGLEKITNNKLAFINFGRESLLNHYPLLLPKDSVVIEILETVEPTKKVLKACKELKEKGYTLALDDYIHSKVWLHFFPYIDIIKMDFVESCLDEIKQVVEACKNYNHIKLLAEKIETYEEFDQAVELGFSYFQGYFFSQPEVLKSASVEPSQLSIIELMQTISGTDPDIDAIQNTFETDVNLSFKLLRYVKSPLFARVKEVTSIKQALVSLGLDEVRRFISLLFTAQFTDCKPQALTQMALIRARFCESLAKQKGQSLHPSVAYLTGMLSLIDGMLDAPLIDLIQNLPLSEDIKQALCENKGQLAQYLALVKAIESANWQMAISMVEEAQLDFDHVENDYASAIDWALARQTAV